MPIQEHKQQPVILVKFINVVALAQSRDEGGNGVTLPSMYFFFNRIKQNLPYSP